MIQNKNDEINALHVNYRKCSNLYFNFLKFYAFISIVVHREEGDPFSLP